MKFVYFMVVFLVLIAGIAFLLRKERSRFLETAEPVSVPAPAPAEQVTNLPATSGFDVLRVEGSESDPGFPVVETDPALGSIDGASVHALPENSILGSPLAAKWNAEYGTSDDDIRLALDRLRSRGFPPSALNDPALVFQFLPRRIIPALRPHEIIFPEQASAGEDIPFQIKGALPDASVSFTGFDIAIDGQEIRIRPVGRTSGEPAPGMEIPIEMEGKVPPLSAGVYRVFWPDYPDYEGFTLTVK